MKNGLKWYQDNAKHHTGFDDGAPWAWVFLGDDDTHWWETDCAPDGTLHQVSGFATAEEAKDAADAAWRKWSESQGDPLADMEPIAVDAPVIIGTPCDIYGYCPYGCQIGDSRCISCTVFTEDDVDNPFDGIDWEDEDE